MASILQVCTYYDPLGGIESAIRQLATGLKTKCKVEVLCTKSGSGTNTRQIDGVKVTSVGSWLKVKGRPLAHQFPIELLHQSADIMHYHLPFPLGVASHLLVRPKTKLVVTFHCDLIRYTGFKKAFEPLSKTFLNACDAILVTSKDLIESTPALKPHQDRCHVVPYGVDEQRFNNPRHDKIAEIHAKYGKRFVLFVGRLAYYKGLDVLIRAMKQVDIPLVIVGSGELEQSLQQLIADEELCNRVHLAGPLYDEGLIDMYHACEMFVLPSTSVAEAFGLVQVEAMLAGKPVINTFLASGVPTVSLDRQTGFTVPPNDSQALAQAINKLAHDHSLREHLGAKARERSLKFYTADRYLDSVWSVYQQLLTTNVPNSFLQKPAVKLRDSDREAIGLES